MSASVFDFEDYKDYLAERLPTQGAERGARARLAEKLRCQPAFVSQVLVGRNHFSLEHAAVIDDFLAHSDMESQYFMLLVHQGRAGSQSLQRYYGDQLSEIQLERAKISERVSAQPAISKEESHRYYSTWYYAAIHVLLTIPGMGDKRVIAERLGLSLVVVSEALEFLVAQGLAVENEGIFKTSSTRVHLGNDSSMIHKHHTNWRIRSLNSLDSKDPINLHYSGPISISRKNAEKLRGQILQFIESLEPMLAENTEEELYGVVFDLFKV